MPELPQPFPDQPDPLPDTLSDEQARQLTWGALLALWTDFARAAAAVPPELDAARWRAAAAPIIGLQAVTFALSDLAKLPPSERPLALDRAELAIRQQTDALQSLWPNEPLPHALQELVSDANLALKGASEA